MPASYVSCILARCVMLDATQAGGTTSVSKLTVSSAASKLGIGPVVKLSRSMAWKRIVFVVFASFGGGAEG